MIDKSKSSLSEVLSQIKDGATILIGGFGTVDGQSYMFIGQQKGRNTKERQYCGGCQLF